MKHFDWANATWPLLVRAAADGKLLTYKEVQHSIGLSHWRNVRHALAPIQDLLLERGYPPLTSLVVNAKTHRPGAGFVAWPGDPKDAHENCYSFDWSHVDTPFPSTLRENHPQIFAQLVRQPVTSLSFAVSDREVVVNGRGPYQAYFRQRLIRAYHGQCALCDTRLLPMLVGSHIIPWAIDRENRLNPQNGILLCKTHDTVFELGVLCIELDFTVRMVLTSDAMGQDLLDYLEQHTNPRLRKPADTMRPASHFLQWRLSNAHQLPAP